MPTLAEPLEPHDELEPPESELDESELLEWWSGESELCLGLAESEWLEDPEESEFCEPD